MPTKNVVQGYALSAEIASRSERGFRYRARRGALRHVRVSEVAIGYMRSNIRDELETPHA